jgi:ankyrin repeat protein
MNTFKKPFNPNMRKTFTTIIAPEVQQPTEKIAQLFSLIEQGNIADVKKFVLSSRIKLSYKMDEESVLHKVLQIDDLKMPEPKKLEFIEYLVTNGAYVNAYDKYNVTPLHLAVQKRYPSIVEFLLSKGANINAQTSESLTPLHYATLLNIQPCPPKNIPQDL